MKKLNRSTVAAYAILIAWCLVVLFPIYTMLINSVKPQREIFRNPFLPHWPITFDGFQTVWNDGRFDLYFRNSIFVTLVSLTLIILLGSLAAYALAMWRSRWSMLIYIFFIAGLMIPIRLGTINIFQIIQSMGLTDSVFSLIPVYVAMGLPISVFVLTTFIRGLPADLIDAAHVDGAGELRIYRSVIMPLIRPAVATVVIFNLIPVWNDLWFPLIFIRAENQRTVILGVSLLFGQYQTNWTRILAALSMAAIPILILYLLMSKQFIKGLTAGAVKG
ncbi:MAG TPA: carbohydrate ABC transporter permease [Anaerolineae bacterium]|nr:carbohydrate ABC transporter permease [Anaerolineae bacterium]HNU03135.1 carbohydrate ABC transporter permease [Anaerolineae bacterium]